ncbi:MAG: hypothetical protein BAJALOKI3v1_20128 [Promethearchaeota archaeon]|nr:MAG: hypothetical protein BAJALOKI3v1_20128 [Candidatus Lokiarchaeota archaeon]
MAKKKSDRKEKEDSLDSALKSTKKTENDLQNFISALQSGKGFYKKKEKKVEKDEVIEPQLSYVKKEEKEEESSEQELEVKPPKPPSSVKETPSFVKEGKSKYKGEDVYEKLGEFFEKLFNGNQERYNQWENSISALLSLLRKMRKITKKNTEALTQEINKAYEKIRKNLDQFKLKRDEIEKIAEVDIQGMSREFRKVLGLLELQVKEYQLKRMTDEIFH